MQVDLAPCWYDRRYWLGTVRFVDLWFLPSTSFYVVDDFGNLVPVAVVDGQAYNVPADA